MYFAYHLFLVFSLFLAFFTYLVSKHLTNYFAFVSVCLVMTCSASKHGHRRSTAATTAGNGVHPPSLLVVLFCLTATHRFPHRVVISLPPLQPERAPSCAYENKSRSTGETSFHSFRSLSLLRWTRVYRPVQMITSWSAESASAPFTMRGRVRSRVPSSLEHVGERKERASNTRSPRNHAALREVAAISNPQDSCVRQQLSCSGDLRDVRKRGERR